MDFRLSGPDGQYGSPDDYWSMAKLYVPVNQVVRLNMRSMDVIHSLAVPNLRLRQDIVPGRIISAGSKRPHQAAMKSSVLSCAGSIITGCRVLSSS